MSWSYFKSNKIFQKLKSFLSQGLNPHFLSLSITTGIIVGTLPLLVVNTWLIFLVALFKKINVPLALFINYAIWPVHLLLIIPYIKIGTWLSDTPMTILSIDHFKSQFSESIIFAFQEIGGQLMCGILGWLVISAPLSIALFYFIKIYFERNMTQSRIQ